MSIQTLTPGDSVNTPWAAISEPARLGSSDADVGYNSRVIARWIEEHFIDYTTTRRIGIAIAHIGSELGFPPKATVYASRFDPSTGTAYQPGTGITITDWEYDEDFAWDSMTDPETGAAATRGAWLYFFDLATLATDGMVEVRAVCEPHANSFGYSRVLQGLDPTATNRDRSELSLLLNSKAVSSSTNRTIRYADSVNGNDTTGDGSSGNPYATITKCRVEIRTAQSLSTNSTANLGGGTIYLKAGTYTPPDESIATYNYNAAITISAAPGVDREDVVIQVSSYRTRIVNVRFVGVTLTPSASGAPRLLLGESSSVFTLRGGGTGNVQTIYFRNCEIRNANVEALADPFVGDHLGLGITGASYTASSRTITKTGAFSSYTFVSGHTVRFTDTGSSTTYQCQVASKTSNDAIVLTAAPGSSSGLQNAPGTDIVSLDTTAYKYWPTNIKPSNAIHFGMFSCYVHHWHDTAALTAFQVVHNCHFDTIGNNGPNPHGAFTYVTIHKVHGHSATPGIHVDAMQWGKTGTVASPDDANSIVLNVRAWDIKGQGWHHEGSRHNIVVANTHIARTPTPTNNLNIVGSNNNEDQSLNHFCVWHLTMLGYNNLKWSDPGTNATHTARDISTRGCLLDAALQAYYSAGAYEVTVKDVSQTSATKAPNYTSAPGYDASVSFGYADITAEPTIGNFPPAGAAGTTVRFIPFDLAREVRGSSTARGAFAAAAESADTPSAPSAFTATMISGAQIDLAWTDESDDETGFLIETSPNGSTGWTEITTTDADEESYSHTGLTPGTTYYYRISAVNDDGASGYATANATTPGANPSFLFLMT